MPSATVPHRFVRGDQRIQVRITTQNGAAWRLDDVGLTVIVQKR